MAARDWHDPNNAPEWPEDHDSDGGYGSGDDIDMSPELFACYDAIFGISAWHIPPYSLTKYLAFESGHFPRALNVRTLSDFHEHFADVLELFYRCNFIEQYKIQYAGFPEMSITLPTTDAAIANLRVLDNVIRRKGNDFVTNSIHRMIQLHILDHDTQARAILDFLAVWAESMQMSPPMQVSVPPSTLGVFYDAIVCEFIPLDDVRMDKYLDFVQVHHRHTPKILTLDAFHDHYDVVLKALHDHDFIAEYAQNFPGRHYTSRLECETNLTGLRDAIASLGTEQIENEIDYMYSLHPNIDYDALPRNVRSPVENDIMLLIHFYRPRLPLAKISVNTERRRRPGYTDMDDTAHTDENKENVRPPPTAPTPARRPAQPPTQPLPHTPAGIRPLRAHMPVSKLFTQLRTLQHTA